MKAGLVGLAILLVILAFPNKPKENCKKINKFVVSCK
jgi:hypothetical protein